MKIGYARVSTADQNPAHQRDALLRAGVEPEDIYIDVVSGSRSSRPQLDVVRRILREGDQLIVTRLDRLSRSLTDLVLMGSELRTKGVEFRATEQGIDTTTAEGRMLFGMLGVMAEFQRELIIANTRDGLAAARARGRVGGRRPALSEDQAAVARRMYAETGPDGKRAYTVQAIADALRVKRSTVYGYLDKSA